MQCLNVVFVIFRYLFDLGLAMVSIRIALFYCHFSYKYQDPFALS